MHREFSPYKYGERCDSIHASRSRTAAEELQTGAKEEFKNKFDADCPDALTSMENLAFALKEQDNDEEADRLMHECVSSLTCITVSNNPHTLSPATTPI